MINSSASLNITLRQIRAFVAVAQQGRFALAASRLAVTPPALSMLIRQLEEGLGARLFDRHTRVVRLTDIGAQFLPVARKSLADLESACGAVRDHALLRSGRVSVAASAVLAATLLPWALQRFSARRPGIRFVLKDVVEQQIRQLVRAGDVDLGIGTSLDTEPDIEETQLLEDRLVGLLPTSHPLASKRMVTWRDFADQPLIVLGAGSPLRTLVERAFDANGIAVTPAYEVSFSSTVISMVASGVGVAALPLNARQVTARAKVQVRPLIRPTVPRRVCLFRRQDTELAPAARAFAEFLLRYIGDGHYPSGGRVALPR